MNNLGVSLKSLSLAGIVTLLAWGSQSPKAQAIVLEFGDRDCLGSDCYEFQDPTTGATLVGLKAEESSFADEPYSHNHLAREIDDYLGTDQIYCTALEDIDINDGYCNSPAAIFSSLTTNFDYSSAFSSQETIESLTLGLAASDFQTQDFGGNFVALVNGQEYNFLSRLLDNLNNGGPSVQFFSVGIPLNFLTEDNQLALEISKEGDSRDGIALDYATIGITTVPAYPTVPTPAAILPALIGMASAAVQKKSKV